ncbi:agmatine deiminase family protein [Cochlodiniinecator piscidefendens]|uniref:agmatine deiminase family protein n=1 Tax=Cochlodiniinecator piscidefendens TaxID=2715756 RepID=UPI001E5E0216|nr:agmatine deiminase family protein [Cochlodiniinecator piscidefendens]
MNRRRLIKGGAALAAVGFHSKLSAQEAGSYRVPAEEAPHQFTFMQWPASRQVYSDSEFLDLTQQTIADIANTISEFEPVKMLADASLHRSARQKLSASVELWDIPTEDLWCRDAGPIFAINNDRQLAIKHIQFNGWGEKQTHQHDSQIARRVADHLELPLIPTELFGEAGGVEQDGHGLLIAHESSWVNRNRNPGMSRADIERHLLQAYGAERLIWSNGVWGEDITDYHIDSLARFTGPGRVLVNLPEQIDDEDPFHRAALETHERLITAGLDVETIPEPNIRRITGPEFVASYANYYACNSAIIAAQFGDAETDQIAETKLKQHYPDREIVMLNVDPLGELGGGIHCATQQMPAV